MKFQRISFWRYRVVVNLQDQRLQNLVVRKLLKAQLNNCIAYIEYLDKLDEDLGLEVLKLKIQDNILYYLYEYKLPQTHIEYLENLPNITKISLVLTTWTSWLKDYITYKPIKLEQFPNTQLLDDSVPKVLVNSDELVCSKSLEVWKQNQIEIVQGSINYLLAEASYTNLDVEITHNYHSGYQVIFNKGTAVEKSNCNTSRGCVNTYKTLDDASKFIKNFLNID